MRHEDIHEELTKQVKEREEKNLPYIIPNVIDEETNTIWILYDETDDKRMWGLWASRDKREFAKMTKPQIDGYVADFLDEC